MKKIILFTLIVLFSFTGCGSSYNSSDNSNMSSYTFNNDNWSNYVISLRSYDELCDLRKSLELPDKELEQYLINIEGGSAKNRDDVEMFLKLVDTLPIINFWDGELTWICYEARLSPNTNNFDEYAFITVKCSEDKWVRFEYFLSGDTDDIKFDNSPQNQNIIFDKAISDNDGRIKIYAESITKHPSGVGNVMTLFMKVDGISTRMVYYNSEEMLDIESNIDSFSLYTLSDKRK